MCTAGRAQCTCTDFSKSTFFPTPSLSLVSQAVQIAQATYLDKPCTAFFAFFIVCWLAGILPFHYSLCITFPKGLLRFSFADIYISRPWGN